MTFTKDLENLLKRFYTNKAKVANWTQVEAVKALNRNAQEQHKNQEAESSWVRRNVWGSEESAHPSEEEEMGHTILGDISQPAPVIVNQPPNNNLLPLALVALGTLGIGGAAGYYLANKGDDPPPLVPTNPEYEDESFSIGLGRIEDYE